MTSDEEVFVDERLAADHQKKLNRCIQIDEIVNHPHTLPNNRTTQENAVIVDFLMGNWNTLTRLFKT
jgi:hypothetical protein